MSDIFVKSKKNDALSDFIDTDTVSSLSLPKWLSVVDIPDKVGGAQNSDMENTATSELESKLRQIFKDAETNEQVGGKKRKSKKVDVTEDGKKVSKKKKASKKKVSKKKASKKKASKKKASKKKASKKSKKMTNDDIEQEGGKKKKKASKKVKKMTDDDIEQEGGKRKKKASKKSSKKASKKASKKSSKKKASKKKVSKKKKASKKMSKKMSDDIEQEGGKRKKASKKKSKKTSKKTSKKKRSKPAHSDLQVEVIKMICERDGIKYPQGMKKLKEYGKKANGFEHEKGGDYIAYLKKTKEWLKKN